MSLQKDTDKQKKQLPTPTQAPSRTTPLSLGTKTVAEDVQDVEKAKAAADGLLDIRTLREKSRNLDLPLISALCNDRSLLKQTNAFVMPRHPGENTSDRPVSWHVETSPTDEGTSKKSFLQSLLSSKSVSDPSSPLKHSYSTTSKVKYPVSGLSTTQIVKPTRKASRHTHPRDTNVTKVGRSKSTSSAKKSDTILPQ